MRERGLLRRVAAILFHRRAGFSANGMGVWKVPDEQDRRDRPADGRPSAGSRTATSARPTRTGPTRSSRWPTAAPRRSATRSSTRSPSDTGIAGPRDALLARPSSRRSACCTSPTSSSAGKREHARRRERVDAVSLRDTRSAELYARAARACCPAASTRRSARCARSGATRSSSTRGEGAELVDVDGNRYVDYVCSWGPLIHGHAHPRVVAAVDDGRRARDDASARRPTGEVELAEEVARARAGRSRCCG